MAFVRKKVVTYKWPVTVETPSDGGRFDRQTFDAEFKWLKRSEFEKLVDSGDLQLLETVLVGWDGIVDEDNQPLEFTTATRKELLDDPAFARGCVKAYLASLDGAQAKN